MEWNRSRGAWGALLGLLMAGSGAQATVIAGATQWVFTAQCVDCAAAAGSPGYGVSLTYFLPPAGGSYGSLSYSGSNLLPAIGTLDAQVWGADGFSPFGVAAETALNFDVTLPLGSSNSFPTGVPVPGRFRSHADGTWTICVSFGCLSNNDYGTGTWGSAFTGTLGPTGAGGHVPEPAPLALAAAALVMCGVMRRRGAPAAG